MIKEHHVLKEYAYHTLVVPIQFEPNCKKRTERDYATKRTRLYLNQRHSHQKDDSGIHDNPVFAGLIILSEQD